PRWWEAPVSVPIRPGWPTFFGAAPALEPKEVRADVFFLGAPFDQGTNDRPGARFGPLALREASMRFEPVDKGEGWLDAERGERTLRGVSMTDAGDVDIRTVEMEENFRRITEAAAFVRSRCRLPVFARGDPAITCPLSRALDDRSLPVVQFDAHQDYSDEKYGQRFSHDNQMRRVSELPFVKQIVQVGLRGALEHTEPWDASRRHGVPDPSLSPGTGFPEPGGIGYYHLKEALLLLAQRTRIIAFDVCEVCPAYDPAGVTPRIAARLMLDLLGAIIPSKE